MDILETKQEDLKSISDDKKTIHLNQIDKDYITSLCLTQSPVKFFEATDLRNIEEDFQTELIGKLKKTLLDERPVFSFNQCSSLENILIANGIGKEELFGSNKDQLLPVQKEIVDIIMENKLYVYLSNRFLPAPEIVYSSNSPQVIEKINFSTKEILSLRLSLDKDQDTLLFCNLIGINQYKLSCSSDSIVFHDHIESNLRDFTEAYFKKSSMTSTSTLKDFLYKDKIDINKNLFISSLFTLSTVKYLREETQNYLFFSAINLLDKDFLHRDNDLLVLSFFASYLDHPCSNLLESSDSVRMNLRLSSPFINGSDSSAKIDLAEVISNKILEAYDTGKKTTLIDFWSKISPFPVDKLNEVDIGRILNDSPSAATMSICFIIDEFLSEKQDLDFETKYLLYPFQKFKDIIYDNFLNVDREPGNLGIQIKSSNNERYSSPFYNYLLLSTDGRLIHDDEAKAHVCFGNVQKRMPDEIYFFLLQLRYIFQNLPQMYDILSVKKISPFFFPDANVDFIHEFLSGDVFYPAYQNPAHGSITNRDSRKNTDLIAQTISSNILDCSNNMNFAYFINNNKGFIDIPFDDFFSPEYDHISQNMLTIMQSSNAHETHRFNFNALQIYKEYRYTSIPGILLKLGFTRHEVSEILSKVDETVLRPQFASLFMPITFSSPEVRYEIFEDFLDNFDGFKSPEIN